MMLKACSFLPAATTMIQQLGLEKYLCGVTFECPSDKPKVVRSHLEGNTLSSDEIEKVVSEYSRQGKSLYYLDEELLNELSPDIIFTQEVCEVCQIDLSFVEKAVSKLKKQPILIPLTPKNLDDVYQNAITIAKAVNEEHAAYKLLASLKKRTDYITDQLRANNAPVKRVMVIEWMKPVYNCGHWIPFQVALAGGVDMLSNPSGYSVHVDWDKIVKYNPEVLVIAPCGFDIKRTCKELGVLTSRPGWETIKAVADEKVYLADADLFTQPGTKLIDGVELLSALFHPEIFKMKPEYKQKYSPVYHQINV